MNRKAFMYYLAASIIYEAFYDDIDFTSVKNKFPNTAEGIVSAMDCLDNTSEEEMQEIICEMLSTILSLAEESKVTDDQ